MSEWKVDPRVIRGIVLHILAAYIEPSAQNEKEIEGLLPLLFRADPTVRDQAVQVARLWLGLKHRNPISNRRLIYYRLRHLDNALSELELATRPKKEKNGH